MSKFSPREAVCQYMGWDFSEASDYRYHYGRTAIPIYSMPDGYVCALANGKTIPKRTKEYLGLINWRKATGSQAEYCESRGYTVWIADQ